FSVKYEVIKIPTLKCYIMADMQNLVERLERAVGRLEAVSQASGTHCGYADGAAKDDWQIGHFAHAQLNQIAEMVHTGLKLERALLVTASQCQKPAGNKLSDLLAPISEQIQEVITFREKNRGSKLFNHLSGVSESIQALGWVAMVSGTASMGGKGQIERGKEIWLERPQVTDSFSFSSLPSLVPMDKKHVDWVRAYLSIWTELQAYIKEFHNTGLAWSKTINQGESITHALKHVSDDLKTHKNPALKTQSAPVRSGPKPFSASKPGVSPCPKPVTKKEPALLELEGKKWRVENQENVSNLVIDDTELKQVAYIFKCVNSTLQIKGKINSITVDNCKKLGLVFDDVVGIVEIINSRDVKVQVMGKVPTISINKTDGCHVYLSKNSLDCEIVSAKSSEMNVLIPTEGDDFNEFPVPEQFKTVWNGRKLVTTVTEIAG
ncbi:hypothetical protein E2I00_004832, partial [Balaenoptera physalus]